MDNSQIVFLNMEIGQNSSKNAQYKFYKNLAGSLKCVRKELVVTGDTIAEKIIFNKKGQVLQNTITGIVMFTGEVFQYHDTKYEKNIKYKKPRIKLPNTDDYTEA